MMTTQNVNESGVRFIEELLEEDKQKVDMSIPLQQLFDECFTFISKVEI